ncbi:Hexose transporter [Candida maltosa Xu316]|uniref:Hexose transporter n=1 Tax=Candida maltosa (strain Xu316) TaxID=1245528 RepID=M3IG22_CANMX|nr:Hexose transporter [Candida maltosa Xu316]
MTFVFLCSINFLLLSNYPKMSEDNKKNDVLETVDSINEESTDKIKVEKSIDDYLYLDKPFYRYKFLNVLNWYIFLNTISCTSNGYDGSLLNGLQILEIWRAKMGNPEGAVLGALSNGVVFGGLISALFTSWMCDNLGRKPTVLIGAAVTVLGSILQGVSTNFAFFLVARIIIGVGTNINSVASPTLISEISYPKYRATAVSNYPPWWYFGAMIAAWVTYGTHNINSDYSWRIPSYLQGTLALFQFVCCCISMPESPRFLVSKGHVDRARDILRELHTGNDYSEKATALVEFELQEIRAAIELEKVNTNSFFRRRTLFLSSAIVAIAFGEDPKNIMVPTSSATKESSTETV